MPMGHESRMHRTLRRIAREAGGNVAITAAIALPVLVGFAGLGVETGYWYFEERRLQSAADLAAFAGAVAARAEEPQVTIVESAETEAVVHGFDPAAGTMAVNWPPLSGSHQNARSVEVILDQTYARSFSALFAEDAVAMSVRAVASYDPSAEACVLALNREVSEGLLFSGSANARFSGCDLMSNSVAEDAVSIEGAVEVEASCVNSAGGIEVSATLILLDCPEVRRNMPWANDPFADMPFPEDEGGCESVPGGPGAKTLSPGRYCSGFHLSGDVELEPGNYIISNNMHINGNTNLQGDGVSFFLTEGTSLTMNGTPHIDLTAPSTGDYAGMLFYGHPNSTGSVTFNGTANSNLTGALYFPSQHVAMRGDFHGSGGCTRIVGNTIEVRGNPEFGTDCTGVPMGDVRAPGAVRLVE